MVIIIDYGMGNLKSVVNALKKLDIPCRVSCDNEEIASAKALILPGVGAFKDAMDNINKLKLIEVIKRKVEEGCPLLGICLGMQMLFERGFEGEERQGLGLLKGYISLIEPKECVKIPHIGWNRLEFMKNDVLTQGLEDDSFVYYVHSYCATDVNKEDLVAYSEYGGAKITGLVRKDNVMGAQFHPEKSGEIGLKILKNFGEMIK